MISLARDVQGGEEEAEGPSSGAVPLFYMSNILVKKVNDVVSIAKFPGLLSSYACKCCYVHMNSEEMLVVREISMSCQLFLSFLPLPVDKISAPKIVF